MSRHFGKASGPWLWIGKMGSRWDMKGKVVGYRLVLDHQSGIFLNLAVAWNTGGVSAVLGWYPNHRKARCKTGYGVVYLNGEEPVAEHRCWATKLGDRRYEWPALR